MGLLRQPNSRMRLLKLLFKLLSRLLSGEQFTAKLVALVFFGIQFFPRFYIPFLDEVVGFNQILNSLEHLICLSLVGNSALAVNNEVLKY
jgi:hypothetical protein